MNRSEKQSVTKALLSAASVLAMAYDPESTIQRKELAHKLAAKLGEIGFVPSKTRTKDHSRRYAFGKGHELVFTFHHRKDPGLTINVFTSIMRDGESVRGRGKDAIRVCTEYQTKALQGGTGGFSTDKLVFKRELKKDEVAKCTVQRRGASVDAIVDRVVERARSAYKSLNLVQQCGKCSAPIARSKNGKLYCTEACWTK